MTKAELIRALEGAADDAEIIVRVDHPNGFNGFAVKSATPWPDIPAGPVEIRLGEVITGEWIAPKAAAPR